MKNYSIEEMKANPNSNANTKIWLRALNQAGKNVLQK